MEIETEARTSGQTGVEMEALTAASVAALTVYDMVKGIERGVEIAEVVLLEKSGGRHDWRRDPWKRPAAVLTSSRPARERRGEDVRARARRSARRPGSSVARGCVRTTASRSWRR